VAGFSRNAQEHYYERCYRPLSLLSVPSKILESCVADALTKHVLLDNRLVTNKQWAYRKGYSTELLLAHLTETWRRAIDSKQVVGVVFIDFQKAFDSVSHTTLIHKLKHYFRIDGYLLDWLKDYLSNRKQFTVMNGKKSDYAQVTYGIPQGSVLGRTLFNLYTSDLPDSVTSGEVYMYADDTTIYCMGSTIDHVTTLILNDAQNIDWVTHSRLLGVTIDNKLTWSRHILEKGGSKGFFDRAENGFKDTREQITHAKNAQSRARGHPCAS